MTSFSGDSNWVSSENSRLWYHRFVGNILRRGMIPKHVAFILDGNRTFAKKNSLPTNMAHEKGFGKVTEVLQWCLDMGIFEVTVWTFSIENFKRTKEEVDILMNLARDKFRKLIQEWRNLGDSGICVRVVGNLTLIPKDLLKLILVAMLLTKDNKRARLNIAFMYTSKDEISSASDFAVHGISNSELENTNVTEDLIDRCLYTYLSAPPDIIVRTSGQYRLSDFLQWQGSHSYLHITNALWPEFSVWHFMYAIFSYQQFAGQLKKSLNRYKLENKNVYGFGKRVQARRVREAIEICECGEEPINWKTLTTFTKKQLYDYYSKTLSSSIDAVLK